MSTELRQLEISDLRVFRGDHTFKLASSDEGGLTLIEGPNGAGKTSLIRSFDLCLYGSDPERTSPLAPYSKVDRLDSGEAAKGQVAITFRGEQRSKAHRLIRPFQTAMTPRGPSNDILEPELQIRESGEWIPASEDPGRFVDRIIPEDISPLVFHDSNITIGVDDDWGQSITVREIAERLFDAGLFVESPQGNQYDDLSNTPQEAAAELVNAANHHFNVMTTNDKYELVFSDTEGLQLDTDGRSIPPRMLSAGETNLLSLSLLLAVDDVIPLSLPLVLDSPFAYLEQGTQILDQIVDHIMEQSHSRQVIIAHTALDDSKSVLTDLAAQRYSLEHSDDGSILA